MVLNNGGGLETPVVLLIFNRPDFTETVFREIARAKPKRLVSAPSPRPLSNIGIGDPLDADAESPRMSTSRGSESVVGRYDQPGAT